MDFSGFISDITTIAQSRCEHCEDYADIETLVCQLPVDHLTFAAHDAFAPYSGSYSMVQLVRACLLKEINGWNETTLHDYLGAHPVIRRRLGFETLPDQSTFWRAWNERFSVELCDAVQECADRIITAARACDVSLPDRIGTDEPDEPQPDERPKHQLIAETTDEVWQQAKPFVCDTFALDRGQNWQIHENAFWEQHAYMGMREDLYARSGPASFFLDDSRVSHSERRSLRAGCRRRAHYGEPRRGGDWTISPPKRPWVRTGTYPVDHPTPLKRVSEPRPAA